jgi:hypothetical protein
MQKCVECDKSASAWIRVRTCMISSEFEFEGSSQRCSWACQLWLRIRIRIPSILISRDQMRSCASLIFVFNFPSESRSVPRYNYVTVYRGRCVAIGAYYVYKPMSRVHAILNQERSIARSTSTMAIYAYAWPESFGTWPHTHVHVHVERVRAYRLKLIDHWKNHFNLPNSVACMYTCAKL